MELTWYGRTCIRLQGKDAVVVNDPYQPSSARPGAGSPATSSRSATPTTRRCRKKAQALARRRRRSIPTSLEAAFVLDGPGEYEVHDVLLTGVRTYRDDAKGAERGRQVAFVIELDGIHTIHLGDIGHLLTEEKLARHRPVDVACVPIGGALSATPAAELIAQLDPKIVVPMPVCEDEADCDEALAKFFHEMGATPTGPAEARRHDPSSLPDRDDDRAAGVARQGLSCTRPRRPDAGQPAPRRSTTPRRA